MTDTGVSGNTGVGAPWPASGEVAPATGRAAGGQWPAGGGVAPGGGALANSPQRWLILVIIAVAQLMIVLDATVMNIALPSAQRSLHFSLADRQWVVTAYALAFGSLLLLGGKLSDLLGRKRTFIAGLIGFAAASAVGGAATSFAMLASARRSGRLRRAAGALGPIPSRHHLHRPG